MNRVFQVIWSHAIGAWIVVSECASRRRNARSHGVRRTFAQHRLVVALLAALGPWSAAHAQSIFWDGNDTTANADGGNGTWQEGGTNWDSAAGAGANTAWNGTLPNDAVFGGTAGTVTIAPAGVTAHNLTFNITSYTVSGGTLTLGGATPTISVTGSANISSVVAGSAGLAKDGAGALTLAGTEAFDTTRIDGGTLAIEAGATLASRHTTLAGGATLRIDGTFAGTNGDDSFTSAGNIVGALDFGAGNDRIAFAGGDLTELAFIEGGAGNDTLAFSNMALDEATLPGFANIERMALLDGSALQLAQALPLGGGTLSIDALSSLTARDGARIAGSVENAGTIVTDNVRMAIDGDYSGSGNAVLQVAVSPTHGTAGGLDITGDVRGSTLIAFDGDGSTVTQSTSIKIVDSPNDVAGEGTFTASNARNGIVRLPGSALDWTFGQDMADGGWYLHTDASSLLPEVPGYVAIPTLGTITARTPLDLAFGHLASQRDSGLRCGKQAKQERANSTQLDDCHGAWAAVSVDEITMGANPGVAFSGDGTSLYMGADIFGHDGAGNGSAPPKFRGGVFAGVQRGNYWTTGEASGALASTAGANIRTQTSGFGAYGTFASRGGVHIDGTAFGQLHADFVGTHDGFRQKVVGESMTVALRGGKTFAPAQGWTLEPHLQLGGIAAHWRDLVDASGKRVELVDDTIGTARADLRMERAFETGGGTHWTPWMTVGMEDTFGESANAMQVGATTLPNHALGLGATVDVGFEARTRRNVSWFGTLSYGTSLQGTDADRRQATIGARVQW